MARLLRRSEAATASLAVCSGGNAIVYEATDKETGEKWALKVIDRAVVTLEDSNQAVQAFATNVQRVHSVARCRPSC